MKFCHFSNFCRKKFPDLTKDFFLLWLYEICHMTFKLQPPQLYKNVQELFCQARILFPVESWKMTECHFWTNVILRQPHVWASKVSPAQKSQGLRVVYSKNFSRATSVVFWGTQLVDRFLIYLPVKLIWRKIAVWKGVAFDPHDYSNRVCSGLCQPSMATQLGQILI